MGAPRRAHLREVPKRVAARQRLRATSLHLSERDLQQAAEATAPLPAAQAAHLRGCLPCQRRVAAYGQIFTVAAQLPPPTFELDLAAGVLAQLPSAKNAKPAFPWALGLLAVLVLGVVGAFFALFGGVLVQALQGMDTGLGVGLAVLTGAVVAGQCLELLARHRRQMQQVAFL